MRGLCDFQKGELTRKVEGFREVRPMEGRANAASPEISALKGAKKKRNLACEWGRWETRLSVNFMTLSKILQGKRDSTGSNLPDMCLAPVILEYLWECYYWDNIANSIRKSLNIYLIACL